MNKTDALISQLQESRDRLDLALEAGNMGIWEWDVATNVITWSPQLQRIFGLEPGSFRGTFEHYTSLLDPRDRGNVMEIVDRAIKTREAYQVEHRIVHDDGTTHWLLGKGRGYYDEAGNLVRVCGVTMDITDRRQAELEYRQMFNLPTNLIAIIGNDGKFYKANPGQKALLDWDPDELVGKFVADYVHPDDAEPTANEIGKLFSGVPVITDFRNRCRHRNGSYRWISWSGTAVDDKVYAIGSDISERIRAEEALSEAVRVRDEFISLASHELKTPLTSMKLQSQMLEREFARNNAEFFNPQRMSKFLNSHQQQIARISRLVEDMLDVSRISLQSMHLEKSQFDLGLLIEETLEKLQGQLEQQGCSVNFHKSARVIGNWDRFRIEQVLINLLTNAAKYGGRKPIQVKLGMFDGLAAVSVADQGCGIRKEDQERIFGRFERVAQDTAVGGLGLGLYISRFIVENHGGKILLQSELGQGSTFTVVLPLAH